jgi:uncharacterized membrane protein YphA (DoxX/SURF4 family)
MPFQPLPDTGPEKPQLTDLGLLVIRVVTVTIFFYYQLRTQLTSAQNFIWDAGEWDLIKQLGAKGLPMPDMVAAGGIAIFTISLLGVFLGFFTRINALVLTLLTGFVLLTPIILSATLNPQSLALYVGLFAGLACGGGGRLSLDYSLANHRERRRKPA